MVRPATRWLSPPSRFIKGAMTGLCLVIYLSTLFPTDAPRAIVVEATQYRDVAAAMNMAL